jgi:hypothetical protein
LTKKQQPQVQFSIKIFEISLKPFLLQPKHQSGLEAISEVFEQAQIRGDFV